MYPWFIIGISGVTCGGKTSLTNRLRDLFLQHFCSRKCTVSVLTLSQDDFFLKPDDPRHVYIPSIGHNNWEVPTAVDLNRMYETALGIISGEEARETEMEYKLNTNDNSKTPKNKHNLKGILLIEGFLVLNHKPTRHLCHLGYYLVLSRAVCQIRRSNRSYDPPDIPGYFERCVWPEHVSRRVEVIGKGKLIDQSDPLSMSELQVSLKEENSSVGDGSAGVNKCIISSSEGKFSAPTTSKKQSDVHEPLKKLQDLNFMKNMTIEDNIKVTSLKELAYSHETSCENLWMRIGGDVLPLFGFGAAGLGLVNGVRVLDGSVISKEKMAKLVLQDVLNEIGRLNFE